MKHGKGILLLIALAALSFGILTACDGIGGEAPAYCGTYCSAIDYGEKTTIEIKADRIEIGGNKLKYTVEGDVLTASNGLRFKIAEDNRVAYILGGEMDSSLGYSGSIDVRNGYFQTRLNQFQGMSEVVWSAIFSYSGNFEFYDIPQLTFTYGTYTLKDGVLIMHSTRESVYGCEREIDHYHSWYIDSRYNINMLVFVKDFSEFVPVQAHPQQGFSENGLRFDLNSDGNGYTVYQGSCSESEIVIPETFDGLPVTAIGKSAFAYKQFIERITIPNGVVTIEDYAFNDTSELKSIDIPDSVTSIGREAFRGCYNMQSATLGKGLTSIGTFAFEWCDFKSIEIPDQVDRIGDGAFMSCRNLETVTIGKGVSYLGGSAFADCVSLKSIKIPDGITEIISSTFHGCFELQSVELPASVTVIGDYSFGYCDRLERITFKGTTEQWKAVEKGINWRYVYNSSFEEVICINGTLKGDDIG